MASKDTSGDALATKVFLMTMAGAAISIVAAIVFVLL